MILRPLAVSVSWLCLLAGTAASDAPASAAVAQVEPPPLTDAVLRYQAISFFLLVLLLSAVAVRWHWNRLARDFPRLPRISYVKSAAVVVLWGLLFLVVLTMIAGTRELMQPGIWRHDGLLYEVADAPPEGPDVGWISATGLLLVGWMGFLRRTLPHVSIRPAGVISGLVVGGLCITLINYLARWYCRTLSARDGARPRRWRLAWSVSIVLAVMVLFVSGLSAIGAARQIGWLASSYFARSRFRRELMTVIAPVIGIVIDCGASSIPITGAITISNRKEPIALSDPIIRVGWPGLD